MSEILSINIKESYSTVIFAPGDGYLHIRQCDPHGQSEAVMLSPEQVKRLVDFCSLSEKTRHEDFFQTQVAE